MAETLTGLICTAAALLEAAAATLDVAAASAVAVPVYAGSARVNATSCQEGRQPGSARAERGCAGAQDEHGTGRTTVSQ